MHNQEEQLIKFEDYFKISSGVFKSVGLNPNFNSKEPLSNTKNWLLFILFHVCFWVLVVTTILELIFVLTVAGDKDQLMDFCRAISCALFDVMGIEEMVLIWMSGNKFKAFILQLEEMFPNDPETQRKYNIRKHAQDTKMVVKNLTSVFVFCIVVWLVGSPCYDALVSHFTGSAYVFDLPFKMWAPVDLDDPVAFNTALFMQFDTIYASVMTILAVNTLFLSIVAQICLQFDMLSQNIRELPPNDEEGVIKLTLMHIRLIDISQQFAELISRTVFVNHILSSIALCCGLFQVVTSETSEIFRFVIYLICVLIQTFNMSYIGDRLIQHVRWSEF